MDPPTGRNWARFATEARLRARTLPAVRGYLPVCATLLGWPDDAGTDAGVARHRDGRDKRRRVWARGPVGGGTSGERGAPAEPRGADRGAGQRLDQPETPIAPTGRERNPFKFDSEVPRESRSAPIAPDVAADSLPELPLPVPGADLRLIGIAGGDSPDGGFTAIVTVGNDLVFARPGDTIAVTLPRRRGQRGRARRDRCRRQPAAAFFVALSGGAEAPPYMSCEAGLKQHGRPSGPLECRADLQVRRSYNSRSVQRHDLHRSHRADA